MDTCKEAVHLPARIVFTPLSWARTPQIFCVKARPTEWSATKGRVRGFRHRRGAEHAEDDSGISIPGQQASVTVVRTIKIFVKQMKSIPTLKRQTQNLAIGGRYYTKMERVREEANDQQHSKWKD